MHTTAYNQTLIGVHAPRPNSLEVITDSASPSTPALEGSIVFLFHPQCLVQSSGQSRVLVEVMCSVQEMQQQPSVPQPRDSVS